jgi:dTDP-4-dehydrorhamnose 3,5-epimerase
MKVEATELPGVLVLTPDAFADRRGRFFELYQAGRLRAHGVTTSFIQDNVSYSEANVVRGLHLQSPHEQVKLVSVLRGEILDVAVDVRVGSPTFGRWVATPLSETNHQQMLIPEGFAHGFATMSEPSIVLYKCSCEYAPPSEITIRWDDPDLAIPWPNRSPILSPKDSAAQRLRDVDPARLPRYRA